jgi:hypothetical protein
LNEVKGEWRRQKNEELTDMHKSPNIFQVIILRRMRWMGYVESLEK